MQPCSDWVAKRKSTASTTLDTSGTMRAQNEQDSTPMNAAAPNPVAQGSLLCHPFAWKKRNVPRKSQHSNLNWSATYCSRTRSLDAAAPMHKAPQQLLTSIGQRQRQQRKSHLDTSVTVLAQMGQDSTLKRWRPTLLHNRTGRSVYLKNHNVWCKS